MSQSQTTDRAVRDDSQGQDMAAIAPAKPCESGAAPAKKKKLSLDIEEIGEVLERKISP